MKTLANCSMAEFLRQTNKIRHAVSEYLTVTEILKIRSTRAVIPQNTDPYEEERIIGEQAKKNISDMLDKALDENAEKTVEILGLLCFKEGKEVEEMEAAEFLDVAMDIVTSDRVISFFTKLMRSGLIDMENTSRK